jgi:hypothetical protein
MDELPSIASAGVFDQIAPAVDCSPEADPDAVSPTKDTST